MNTGAASGVRVIDLSPFMPGHYTSLLLSDLGATVVQVEPPGGLPARHLPGMFESICRNRQSLVLDLKQLAGKDVLYRLVAESDVLIEGFRPGVAARLGVDYPSLKKANASLIYCSISGYGQDGPLRDRMGHDCNYVAMSGGYSIFTQPEVNDHIEPFGLPVADLTASLHAVIAVLAALLERTHTGKGQYFDVAIADGPLSFAVPRFAEYLLKEALPQRGVTRGIFATRDARYLTTGVVEDHAWQALCECVERPDLIGDPRFQTFADRNTHATVLQSIFRQIFRQRTIADWQQRLDGSRLSWAPVRTLSEAFAEPHVAARGRVHSMRVRGKNVPVMGLPVKGARAPASPTPPPRAGEHSRQILSACGYTDTEIAELTAQGVIGT